MSTINKIALSLLAAGALILFGFVFYNAIGEFITTDKVPTFVKAGVGLVAIGLLVSLVALIFERIKDSKNEHYDSHNDR